MKMERSGVGLTTTDKISGALFLLALLGAIAFGIYAIFAYWLEPWREDRVRAMYQECVERGGTITEGFGISCVGVKTPPANP
jgi:hypothetical protein